MPVVKTSPDSIFTGIEEMAINLNRINNALLARAAEGLLQEAVELKEDAKNNYVPVDSTELQQSGHAELVTRNGSTLTARVTFGGARGASAYAVAVHEHPSRHSPPSWRGLRDSKGRFRKVRFKPSGHGPKYLEKPLFKRMSGFTRRMADRIWGRPLSVSTVKR